MNDLERIKQFEKLLDAELAQRPSLAFRGEDSIVLAAHIINRLCSKTGERVQYLASGLSILLPKFIEDQGQGTVSPEQLLKDLLFSWCYYWLREVLYYTYNKPSSMQWSFGEGTVEIKLADPTIARQFSVQFSTWVRSSMGIGIEQDSNRILELLAGEEEFGSSDKMLEAFNLILDEAKRKLERYFDFEFINNETPLGSYSYGEFRKVYQFIIAKALYHRYYATANNIDPCINFERDQFLDEIAMNSETENDIVRRIVSDLAYSKKNKRIQPIYFDIWECERINNYILVPGVFLLGEGFVNILRINALRSPQLFLNHLSGPLGDALTSRIASTFRQHGFHAQTEVRLNHFDASLPDIDVLVISPERTLGYVVFVCETKSPIPPIWAKDQLRATEPDSIAKAFRQLALLDDFLKTDAGMKFLLDRLPTEGMGHIRSHFVTLLRFLVITSNNAGMFFGNEMHSIIDYRTLERIIEQSDGDIAYIMEALDKFGRIADESVATIPVECTVGSLRVKCDAVKVVRIFDFEKNIYRSEGLDDEYLAAFLADDGHPFDALLEDGGIALADDTRERDTYRSERLDDEHLAAFPADDGDPFDALLEDDGIALADDTRERDTD